VIGAGPSGLAAAWAARRAGVPAEVVDMAGAVGGQARTWSFREDVGTFRVDAAPQDCSHALSEELLGARLLTVRTAARSTLQVDPGATSGQPGVKKVWGTTELTTDTRWPWRVAAPRFRYPAHGAGELMEALSTHLAVGGVRLTLETQVVRLSTDRDRVVEVVLADGRHLQPAWITCSASLPDLVRLVRPRPPREVLDAATRLAYRNQVGCLLTLAGEAVGSAQWTAWPDPAVPFARTTEPANLSRSLSPPGFTSLLVDNWCGPEDELWTLGTDELVARTTRTLGRLGVLDPGRVRRGYRIATRHALPVPAAGHERALATVQRWMASFRNLLPLGQGATFRPLTLPMAFDQGLGALTALRRNAIRRTASER